MCPGKGDLVSVGVGGRKKGMEKKICCTSAINNFYCSFWKKKGQEVSGEWDTILLAFVVSHFAMVSLLKRNSMVEDGGRRTALGYVGTHVCIMEILMPDLHLLWSSLRWCVGLICITRIIYCQINEARVICAATTLDRLISAVAIMTARHYNWHSTGLSLRFALLAKGCRSAEFCNSILFAAVVIS